MSDFVEATARLAPSAPAGDAVAPAPSLAARPPVTARTPTAPSSITAAAGPPQGPPAAVPIRLPVAVALALASGLALWAAFPRLGWWPLAPVAVAGLALAVRGRSGPRALPIGLLAGLAFMLPHLHWSGIYVGLLPWFALAFLEALYVAGMAVLMPRAWCAPGGRVGTVVAITGLWVAQEALRDRTPFGGFPWARLAFSQADSPLLGYAALGGAPLVTAAVAATGGCLAVLATATLDRAAPRPRRAGRLVGRGSAVAIVAASAVVAGGTLVPRPTGAARSAAVAAVQGNVPQAGLDFNAQRRAVLDDHVRGTLGLARDVAAGRAAPPDVVLWPENSSDIDPLRNPDAAAVISAATDAVGVPVLIGAVLAEPVHHLSNAGIVWGPAGSAVPGPGVRYVKRHPAPFAEYIPYRTFFRHFSDKVDLVTRDFAPGRTVGVLPAGPARLGDVICFEVAYDDLVRDTVTAGADLLVVQTNNATFGYSDESVQQLAMSRLRAVETARAVVHISTVGVSGLIAPDGRLVETSRPFDAEVLQARLPLRTDQTVATRVGPLPELALAALGAALVLLGGRRRRRRRPHPGTALPGTPTGESAGSAGQESSQ
ncbi:MAG TPA: apolipoprotein N-acyltransferase [Kineosporiaceae bacterium]